MNISNIEQYVERKNSFAKLFGSRELSLLNAKDRQAIANSIDAEQFHQNRIYVHRLEHSGKRFGHKLRRWSKL